MLYKYSKISMKGYLLIVRIYNMYSDHSDSEHTKCFLEWWTIYKTNIQTAKETLEEYKCFVIFCCYFYIFFSKFSINSSLNNIRKILIIKREEIQTFANFIKSRRKRAKKQIISSKVPFSAKVPIMKFAILLFQGRGSPISGGPVGVRRAGPPHPTLTFRVLTLSRILYLVERVYLL